MGMVYMEIFKIIFGILLILILFLINFNLYYLSADTHTDKTPSSQTILITSRLVDRNGYHQSEQVHSVVRPATVMWRYTQEQLYQTTNDDDKEIYHYPATMSMVNSDEQGTDETQQLQHRTTITTKAYVFPTSQPLSHLNHPVKQRGYIVALKIYEQQTMASGNLLQLQCWANYLNVVVLKPFMKDSSLLTPLDETTQSIMLKLDDVFNMVDWNKHATNNGYAPLIEWGDFEQNAPRNLILVQMKYPVLTYVKQVRSKGLPFPKPWDGSEKYKEGCKFRMIGKKASQFLAKNGFKIIRQVCFNFVTGIELPMKQIHADILGDYDASKVTIIIDEWRGLGENQRVLVQEEICREKEPYREHIKPSSKVINNAQLYANMYLNHNIVEYNTLKDNNAHSEYIAVIARFEMTGLTRKIDSRTDDPHAIIPYCLQQTLSYLEKLKQSSGLSDIFLSFDAGKYGSHSFAQKKYYGHYEDLESFVGKVYSGSKNIHDWEKTFEAVSQFTDSGYIAKLQQAIVTRAKCILFVGGGSFQRHALHLYQKLHPDPTDQCILVIEKCTSAYRPID